MTPNRQAAELVLRFMRIKNTQFDDDILWTGMSTRMAKECAKISCDLLAEQMMEIHSEYPEVSPDEEIRFLENVKEEIGKL